MHEPNASSPSRSMHAPPGLHAENDAASQADRVAAETLIRTTVQSVGNGSMPQDLDELVRRNAGRVTREDLRAGRLGSTILGDIINSVEQAKGNTAINWSAATPQQIKAYAMAHGLDFGTFQRLTGGQQPAGDGRPGEKASTVYEGKLAAVTSNNYSGTPFAAAGLSYDTFNALRAQGFGETNIIHAAQDTRTNGFDVNNKKVAGAFATLDKDDGKRRDERNELLGRFRGRLDGDEEFQRLKHARDAAPTTQERAKIDGQLKKRGSEISREVGYHGHVEAAPTERARKAGKLIESETIKQRTEHTIDHSIAPGDPKKAQEIKSIVDTHLRNRNDATARKNYEVLKQTAASDPNKRKALAQLERQLDKDKKLIKSAERQNGVKTEANVVKSATDAAIDDELAAFVVSPAKVATASPATPAQSNATPKKSEAANSAQKKSVTAEGKPAPKAPTPA